MYPTPSAYPYDCVCYVVATYADGTSWQGSGAIIGPHTVLTASHLLWSADLQQSAVSVQVYPASDGFSGMPIGGGYNTHYNEINDAHDRLTEATSQQDFAVIDFAADLSGYGSFGLDSRFTGGGVHIAGYPSSAFGLQTDDTGDVQASPAYATLDYVSVFATPGDSGGPIWVDEGTAGNPQPYVVGVVSTGLWASHLTASDIGTIQGWENQDSILWSSAAGQNLQAGAQLASLSGGDGSDTLTGWIGDATLFGGAGADSIMGGNGFDRVNGNAGDDTIIGLSTPGDWLLGGQGNDSIEATLSAGHNIINGNLGDDTVLGGVGGDTLRGGQGDDLIQGGSAGDWITGDLGANTLIGGAGADTFHAGAGQDRVTDFNPAQGDHVLLDPGVAYQVAQTADGTEIDLSTGGRMLLLAVQTDSLPGGWIVTG
jgi:Ca2+-binding RTX toxin-like protein